MTSIAYNQQLQGDLTTPLQKVLYRYMTGKVPSVDTRWVKHGEVLKPSTTVGAEQYGTSAIAKPLRLQTLATAGILSAPRPLTTLCLPTLSIREMRVEILQHDPDDAIGFTSAPEHAPFNLLRISIDKKEIQLQRFSLGWELSAEAMVLRPEDTRAEEQEKRRMIMIQLALLMERQAADALVENSQNLPTVYSQIIVGASNLDQQRRVMEISLFGLMNKKETGLATLLSYVDHVGRMKHVNFDTIVVPRLPMQREFMKRVEKSVQVSGGLKALAGKFESELDNQTIEIATYNEYSFIHTDGRFSSDGTLWHRFMNQSVLLQIHYPMQYIASQEYKPGYRDIEITDLEHPGKMSRIYFRDALKHTLNDGKLTAEKFLKLTGVEASKENATWEDIKKYLSHAHRKLLEEALENKDEDIKKYLPHAYRKLLEDDDEDDDEYDMATAEKLGILELFPFHVCVYRPGLVVDTQGMVIMKAGPETGTTLFNQPLINYATDEIKGVITTNVVIRVKSVIVNQDNVLFQPNASVVSLRAGYRSRFTDPDTRKYYNPIQQMDEQIQDEMVNLYSTLLAQDVDADGPLTLCKLEASQTCDCTDPIVLDQPLFADDYNGSGATLGDGKILRTSYPGHRRVYNPQQGDFTIHFPNSGHLGCLDSPERAHELLGLS